MRKYVLLACLLFLSTLISGCSTNNNEVVKVMIPSGGPAFGFVQMIHDQKTINNKTIEYEVTSGPDQLTAAITSKSHPIVIAPSNLGAMLYSKDSNYLYAGTITFGNLYLVGKQDGTINDLANKKIAVFGKNTTPDIVLRKVLQHKNMLDKVTLEYFESVNDVNGQFVSGKYDYALLAEPVLSKTRTLVDTHTVADLQVEYKYMTGIDSYPQAAIFINKEFVNQNKRFVSQFLKEVEKSASFVNENKSDAAKYYVDAELAPQLPKDILESSIATSNIRFEYAKDSKQKVEDYFNLILDFNPKLVGGTLPDDSFYLE